MGYYYYYYYYYQITTLYQTLVDRLSFLFESMRIFGKYQWMNKIFATNIIIIDVISIIIHSVNLRIQSEYGKIRTRKTPNKENFHAVIIIKITNNLF